MRQRKLESKNRHRPVLVIAAALLALVCMTASSCVASDADGTTPRPTAAPQNSPAATTEADSEVDLGELKYASDELGDIDEAVFVRMPNLICVDLQKAQDTLQELTGEFFASDSKDASGEGRMQINDSNWVVVDQQPDPGERIILDPNLYALKDDEAEDQGLC